MKFVFLALLLLTFSVVNCQDYIIKPDDTKINGKISAMWKNNIQIINAQGETLEFKIDKLSVVHIADPNFKMKGVYLNNTNYEKNDEGIHIEMNDNPVVKIKNSHSQSSKNYRSKSENMTNNITNNYDNNSGKSSSLSITSQDDSPKAKVILDCDDCSSSGSLVMESEDKSTNVMWTFDCKNGSAFPMEMELDSGKKYNFYYKDGKKQSIEKKVKIDLGVNIINVFQ